MLLTTANRLENLLDGLEEILKEPLPPLQQEIIMVQSQGMARWLSMNLARRFGIWANADFPFPRALAWRMYRAVLPELPETSAFDPVSLQWRITAMLPGLLENAAFVELRAYLEKDKDGLKRCQLARRIAETFDQYVVYRPALLKRWEEGAEEHWQALLWRALIDCYQDTPQRHRAAVRGRFLAALQQGDFDAARLPRRVSVFGISALPPFYSDLLAALGHYIPVYLFIMNPSQHYWGDIVSDMEIARRTLPRPGKPGLSEEEQHLESGNPLLASMGRLGRDFLETLLSYDPVTDERFSPNGEDSLLARLQEDILELRWSGRDTEAYRVRQDDDSVQFHDCHGPLREVEVLYDRLLDCLERDPALRPEDILVMAPDIETYAPLVQAVFGQSGAALPFNIADRPPHGGNTLAAAFLKLLTLGRGRMSLHEVLEILQHPAVREKFEMSQVELDSVQEWLRQAGVRWGVDGTAREELGLGAFAENTWRFGLDRLLLGYALPDQERLYAGIRPCDVTEGQEALLLGRLSAFCERLFQTRADLKQARTPAQWRGRLNRVLEDFFQPARENGFSDAANPLELKALRETFAALEQSALTAEFEKSVELPVILAWLERNLESFFPPVGFISGGVTFCAMLPMRSIPFQIICLLGMNDNAYPRAHSAPGFDLIAREPRRGDRSRRNDDRYLFLEALLSARRLFYISYAGRSIQDNSARPPSVLVKELQDYLEQGFSAAGDAELLPRLTVQHPLQPFSPRYFDGSDARLFSYAAEYCLPAAGEIQAPTLFIRESLPLPEGGREALSLLELVEFFKNPARFLLQKRLGIKLEGGFAVLEDTEPFTVQGLERYYFDQDLAEKLLAGEDGAALLPLFKAAGELPAARVGDQFYQIAAAQVEAFVEQLRRHLRGERRAVLSAELQLRGQPALYGSLRQLWPQAQVFYRLAAVKPKDRLHLWLHHLFLNAAGKSGFPALSVYLGKDQICRLPPLDGAASHLTALLESYREGLCAPLRFFPQTTWDYIEKLRASKGDTEKALGAAASSWEGGPFRGAEGADPYYQQCFSGIDVLDARFRDLAERIYLPLHEILQVDKF